MARKNKLIILLTLLVICTMGYLLASYLTGEDSDSGSLDISVVDSASVESIRWVYEGDTIEIAKRDANSWYYTGDESFPLDSDIAADMLSAVSTIRAVKTVTKEPSELAQYGISDPTIKLFVTVNGTETEYDIGDYNSASGYYYMMYTGDTALYYVDSSLFSQFSVKLLDIAEKEYLPETELESIEKISLETGGSAYNIEYRSRGAEGYGDEYTYFLSEGDTLSPCDTDIITAMITGFTSVAWQSCEAYNVTEADLEKYGLNSPGARFSIQYTYTVETESASGSESLSETVRGSDALLIGNAISGEEGGYYAMIEGGVCVYTLLAADAAQYLISDATELYSKSIINLTKSLTSVTVSFRGEDYTVGISADEDGVRTYTLGGGEIELDSFVSSATALKADSVRSEDITGAGELLLSITANYTDGTVARAELYEYNGNYCAGGVNGSLRYLVDESECDDLYDSFRDAIKALEPVTQEQ